jgi:vacuolar-type H+-ATPase subunit I/STV1
MTTPNIEELIAVLEATNQFHENADICTADVIAALQSQAERINDLETEAEQLRKGHFDTSEANAALRSKFKGMQSEIDELSAELSLVNVDLEITKLGAAKTMQEFMRENRKLREAAQAVIDRWDTPHWKDVPATAEYIGRLRAALKEKS